MQVTHLNQPEDTTSAISMQVPVYEEIHQIHEGTVTVTAQCEDLLQQNVSYGHF